MVPLSRRCGAWARHGVLALLVLATMTSACSVRQSLTAQPGTDLSALGWGATRAQVESVLGPPIKTLRTRGGVVYSTYYFQSGTPKRTDLALANAGLDVATLGLWELVHQRQGYLENRPRNDVMAVSYDEVDRVIDLFPDFNRIAEMPADGRRPTAIDASSVRSGADPSPGSAATFPVR